jgi:type IV secretory pathway protease TraF
MADRGYLPMGVPMLKRILALPGATVCRHGLDIVAYGSTIGRARERDNAGRKMPVWQGCRRIVDGELFLMNFDVSDSVDGRYFGPLPRGFVIGRVLPVFTDEAGDGRFVWRASTR